MESVVVSGLHNEAEVLAPLFQSWYQLNLNYLATSVQPIHRNNCDYDSDACSACSDVLVPLSPLIHTSSEDSNSKEPVLLSNCDFVGAYILAYVSIRRPNAWAGGLLQNTSKSIDYSTYDNTSCTLCRIPGLLSILNEVYLQRKLKVSSVKDITIAYIFHHLSLYGIKNNKGENKANKYTTFLLIQQVTKGGVFVGSNKLKHLTDAMLEMRRESDRDGGGTYMEFTKNRNGECGYKMSFSLGSSRIEYGAIKEREADESDVEFEVTNPEMVR